ncbi:MAG: type II toxin-antitoxin system HicB family antitoxin [Spirosomataceae bacterium]
MKTHHFPILIEQDEDNIYIVTCPTFKGCHSYGKTIDEAIQNIREVIEMCMEEQKIDDSNNFVGFREIEVLQKESA